MLIVDSSDKSVDLGNKNRDRRSTKKQMGMRTNEVYYQSKKVQWWKFGYPQWSIHLYPSQWHISYFLDFKHRNIINKIWKIHPSFGDRNVAKKYVILGCGLKPSFGRAVLTHCYMGATWFFWPLVKYRSACRLQGLFNLRANSSVQHQSQTQVFLSNEESTLRQSNWVLQNLPFNW